MNDEELADEVVALGVGEDHSGDMDWFSFTGESSDQQRAKVFVRDWRVAGALIERVIEWGGLEFIGADTTDTFRATAFRGYGGKRNVSHAVNQSLPRAIIEACVMALVVEQALKENE